MESGLRSPNSSSSSILGGALANVGIGWGAGAADSLLIIVGVPSRSEFSREGSSPFATAFSGVILPLITSSCKACPKVCIPRFDPVSITDGNWNVLPSRMRFLTAAVVSMISIAATRPPPIFGIKVCATTPWSDSAS